MTVKSLKEVNEFNAFVMVGRRILGSRSEIVAIYDTCIEPAEISLR